MLQQSGASHLMMIVKELITKGCSSLLKTHLTLKTGTTDSQQNGETKVPINFYANKLVDSQKRTFAYCLVFQPIV